MQKGFVACAIIMISSFSCHGMLKQTSTIKASKKIKVDSSFIYDLVFDQNKNVIVAGHQALYTWDVQSSKSDQLEVRKVKSGFAPVLTEDGQSIITSSRNSSGCSTIQMWNLNVELIKNIDNPKKMLCESLVSSSKAKYLIGFGPKVSRYDPIEDPHYKPFNVLHDDMPAYMPVYSHNNIFIWDKQSGNMINEFWLDKGELTVALSKMHDLIIAANKDGVVKTYDINGLCKQEFDTGLKEVCSLACSEKNEQIAIGAVDGDIKIVDFAGKLIKNLRTHLEPTVLSFSPEGEFFAMAGIKKGKPANGIIRIWDLRKNAKNPVLKTEKLGARVTSIKFSPKNDLAAGLENGQVALFDNRSL